MKSANYESKNVKLIPVEWSSGWALSKLRNRKMVFESSFATVSPNNPLFDVDNVVANRRLDFRIYKFKQNDEYVFSFVLVGVNNDSPEKGVYRAIDGFNLTKKQLLELIN